MNDNQKIYIVFGIIILLIISVFVMYFISYQEEQKLNEKIDELGCRAWYEMVLGAQSENVLNNPLFIENFSEG